MWCKYRTALENCQRRCCAFPVSQNIYNPILLSILIEWIHYQNSHNNTLMRQPHSISATDLASSVHTSTLSSGWTCLTEVRLRLDLGSWLSASWAWSFCSKARQAIVCCFDCMPVLLTTESGNSNFGAKSPTNSWKKDVMRVRLVQPYYHNKKIIWI